MGGLGLFELDSFLAAQRCSWIQRSLDLDEKWKLTLYFNSYGNIPNIRKSLVNLHENPVLYGVVSAYERFLGGFTKHNENFWGAPLFENDSLLVSLRQKIRLTKNFFDNDFFVVNKEKIFSLKVRDFYLTKDSLIRYEGFCANTNLQLSRDNFNTLKNTCSMAKTKYLQKESSKEKCTELSDFLNRRKQGCKRYRKMILGLDPSYIPHNMVKFAETTETIIDLDTSKKLNAMWAHTALGNSTRTFIFKFHNNTAGYNLCVSHFVRGHSPNCTFCDLLEIPEVQNETPLHLFFQCPAVENLTNSIFSGILNEQVEISQQEFLRFLNAPTSEKMKF
jgi:hypothetical protein